MNSSTQVNTALAVAAGAAVLYASMKPLMEAGQKLHLSPSDDEVGSIPELTYEQLVQYGKCKGKKALLVGGTRGVGLGTAVALAKAGAHVTVVGRSEKSGAKAVQRIKQQAESLEVSFVPGDIGTVASTLVLVDQLEKSGEKHDFLVVSAAIFPNPDHPEPNEDGIEKAFAIGVVGRFLLYRNLHRFLNKGARVLNVLASGTKLGEFDRETTRQPKGLFGTIMCFAMGCEMMLQLLRERDESIRNYTMVSTHPGSLRTDLHRGQGWWFDAIEGFACHFLGIDEETAGLRQTSILTSDKLHKDSLSLVDNFGHGRLRSSEIEENLKEHGDWLWDMLCELEKAKEHQEQ